MFFHRGFPYLKNFVPRDELSRIVLSSFVVTPYIMAPVLSSSHITLGGSSPSIVGSSSEMGDVSTLPWMKWTPEKKGVGAAVHPFPFSLEGIVAGMIVGGAP